MSPPAESKQPVTNRVPASGTGGLLCVFAAHERGPDLVLGDEEALLTSQRDVLRKMSCGAEHGEILAMIVAMLEEQCTGVVVPVIMLADAEGTALRCGAAGSLPEDFLKRLDGLAICGGGIACATAAARGETVLTPDISAVPEWQPFRNALLARGISGVWSVPFHAGGPEIAGTLALYFKNPPGLTGRDRQVAEMLAELAGLALAQGKIAPEPDPRKCKNRRRERLYEAIVSNTPDLNYVFDLDHRFTYANPALLAILGVTWEEACGKNCLELGHEPWQAEMHGRGIDEVVRNQQPVKGEVPFTGPKGRRIYEYIFSPVLGFDGEVEAVSGTTRDVTERKRAEDRARFLSRLTERLAGLTTEQEVVEAAVAATGEFFEAHRCLFAEDTGCAERIVTGPVWLRNASAPCLPNLDEVVDPEWWGRLSSATRVVQDVREDPVAGELADEFGRLQIRSFMIHPFGACGGRNVFIAVTQDQPRDWSAEDLRLLEGVIARTWPMVERIRSAIELRRSEERLRLITDHTPALISYLDAECRFVVVNDQHTKWFGTPASEMLGRHPREVLGEEIYAERRGHIEMALRGEASRTEASAVHRELGRRELDVALVPDRAEDGAVHGFYVMAFDVTDHIRTRKSLSQRVERLRLLWESARILLTTDDPDVMLQRLFGEISGHLGADTYFNYTMADGGVNMILRSYRGISREEAATLSCIGLDDGPCGKVAFNRKPFIIPDSDDGNPEDGEVATRFGIRAYAGYPLLAEGHLLGTLAFGSRSRASFSEDELEFIETISHYVTAAYVRLELVAGLRTADRRKDEFLATLAHELRNPLAPIRTGIEVLKHSVQQPEKLGGVIGIIERQTAQMVRLIDDLMDVSRITRNKMDLQRSVIDLTEVLPNAIEAVQPLIDSMGHSLNVSLPTASIFVDGDAGRLAQVFSNILNNAARYTKQRGHIELGVELSDRAVIVSVRDNGEGIAPAMQELIFDMFAQVRPSGFSATPGLGIGLTLVRLLVEKHGGSIAVLSAGLGKGSEFRVTLPRVPPPSLSPEAESSRMQTPAKSCKILVVDDGVCAADMLVMFFNLEGFEAATAYDGIEALEVAARMMPRVVFLDIGMPRMDGYETARRLRQIPGCENMIIIALTGWGQESDRANTREAGFDHHLVKPVEPDTLRGLMATLDLDPGDGQAAVSG